MPTDFLTVLCEFQERNIRYVLVGGLAVLLHGVDRLTADIDLVVDLAPEQASQAVETLLMLGFKANAPIDARQFADASDSRWPKPNVRDLFEEFGEIPCPDRSGPAGQCRDTGGVIHWD